MVYKKHIKWHRFKSKLMLYELMTRVPVARLQITMSTLKSVKAPQPWYSMKGPHLGGFSGSGSTLYIASMGPLRGFIVVIARFL